MCKIDNGTYFRFISAMSSDRRDFRLIIFYGKASSLFNRKYNYSSDSSLSIDWGKDLSLLNDKLSNFNDLRSVIESGTY